MAKYEVPQDHLKIVVIISGTARYLALTDKEHKNRENRANPNIDLLKKLNQNQVKILVCAQSWAKYKIDADKDLNPCIELTISSLSAVPMYQMEGYVPMF